MAEGESAEPIVPDSDDVVNVEGVGDYLSALGARIRARRIECRLTQVRLGELAGITHTYISAIERGDRNNLTIITLWRLALALRLPDPLPLLEGLPALELART